MSVVPASDLDPGRAKSGRQMEADMLQVLRDLQRALQREKQGKFNRRVSFGDLITDRWQNAQDYGFGEGTSCYDNVLIIGQVTVGRHTWIGPNVILDGTGGGLVIGDHCSISSGVQIYTHNTVMRSVTLGEAPIDYAPTWLGDGVYIGPNSVIAMGTVIGNCAVIGAMSFVNQEIPAAKKAWGSPARIMGDVWSESREPGESKTQTRIVSHQNRR
jgi:acetyltransferase-like isoleucine patch superfamily enzyme